MVSGEAYKFGTFSAPVYTSIGDPYTEVREQGVIDARGNGAQFRAGNATRAQPGVTSWDRSDPLPWDPTGFAHTQVTPHTHQYQPAYQPSYQPMRSAVYLPTDHEIDASLGKMEREVTWLAQQEYAPKPTAASRQAAMPAAGMAGFSYGMGPEVAAAAHARVNAHGCTVCHPATRPQWNSSTKRVGSQSLPSRMAKVSEEDRQARESFMLRSQTLHTPLELPRQWNQQLAMNKLSVPTRQRRQRPLGERRRYEPHPIHWYCAQYRAHLTVGTSVSQAALE